MKTNKLEQLRANNELLNITLQSVEYGITVQDRAGNILYANQAAARMSGYKSLIMFMNADPANVAAKFDILDKDGNKFESKNIPGRRALLDNKPHEAELRFLSKSTGKERWVQVKAIPISAQRGGVEFVVNSFQDITDRKLEARRTEHFISIGSHELKTPLAGIKVLNQIAEKYFREKKFDKINPIFQRIDKKVNELTTIINDFLVVEKIRIGRLEFIPEKFNFDVFLKDVVADLQVIMPTHHIQKRGKVNIDIVADKDRIAEVITNLARNARKYSSPGSTILLGSQLKKEMIMISMKDSGIGISEDDRNHIFEPFYRSTESAMKGVKGLGLGLYISSKIIELHGGRMWVKSKPKQGSTFYFTIPLKQKNNKSAYLF